MSRRAHTAATSAAARTRARCRRLPAAKTPARRCHRACSTQRAVPGPPAGFRTRSPCRARTRGAEPTADERTRALCIRERDATNTGKALAGRPVGSVEPSARARRRTTPRAPATGRLLPAETSPCGSSVRPPCPQPFARWLLCCSPRYHRCTPRNHRPRVHRPKRHQRAGPTTAATAPADHARGRPS